MIGGRYQDTIIDYRGVRRQFPWRSNLVVRGGYELVAALSKRDPRFSGILWWAVGTGDPAWDADLPRPDRDDRNLTDELARFPIDAEHMMFLDNHGAPVASPTPTIQVRGGFAAERLGPGVVLREFGLFGGTATDAPNSGTLVNRVIHPPLALARGELLERRVQLTFGGDERRSGLTGTFGATLPATAIRGMTPEYAAGLTTVGVRTVDDLTRLDPSLVVPGIDPDELRNLVARARATRCFQPLPQLALLVSVTVHAALTATPEELVTMASGPLSEEQAQDVQDSLRTLRVALGQRILLGLSLRNIVEGAV